MLFDKCPSSLFSFKCFGSHAPNMMQERRRVRENVKRIGTASLVEACFTCLLMSGTRTKGGKVINHLKSDFIGIIIKRQLLVNQKTTSYTCSMQSQTKSKWWLEKPNHSTNLLEIGTKYLGDGEEMWRDGEGRRRWSWRREEMWGKRLWKRRGSVKVCERGG